MEQYKSKFTRQEIESKILSRPIIISKDILTNIQQGNYTLQTSNIDNFSDFDNSVEILFESIRHFGYVGLTSNNSSIMYFTLSVAMLPYNYLIQNIKANQTLILTKNDNTKITFQNGQN